MTKEELIVEAKNRGYRSGTLIDYQGSLPGTDTLGNGEFDLVDGNLIKYERSLSKGENKNYRRYDVIWSKKNGWTKIADEPHGFSL